MKNFKILSITTLLLTMLVSCVNSDNYRTPDLSGECADITANKNVLDIINASTSSYVKYVDATPENDDIIEAYVTSSDEGGTFYKSISLVSIDKSKGFSIPVDDYNLYTKYRPGQKVYVNMTNRYIVKEYGSTVIGSLYNNETPDVTSDDEVGRISGAEYQSVITSSCKSISEEELVNKISIETALNDSYLNKLIEFENVQFIDDNVGKTYYDSNNDLGGSATNNYIQDENANKIIVRISAFSNFASKIIPNKNGKIRGVLTKYGSDYQFIIRTENDIKLSNPRVVPVFVENFTSGIGNWTTFNVTGAQVWAYSATYGFPGCQTCGGMMKMSGFSGTAQINEDWLISPVQNLSTYSNASLSFENAYKFAGNPIQVLVSNNYSGTGNPYATGVTWTTITGANLSSGNYVYTNSGKLNISSFAGTGNNNVYIAFKYTSTSSEASTWEIDDVKVYGQ